MRIRFLALVGLAISFALPIFAQQTNTPDPQLHQQLVALFKKFDEVWNSNDHAAWGALFTDDAIEVTNTEPIYGRKALEKNWEDLKLQFSNHVTTVDQYSPHMIGTAANEVWMNGKYSLTVKGQNFGPLELKGNLCSILVREGDAWKTRMLIWNVTPAPAAPTASPSNQ
jgi:ketosteroid isomerase-like protein